MPPGARSPPVSSPPAAAPAVPRAPGAAAPSRCPRTSREGAPGAHLPQPSPLCIGCHRRTDGQTGARTDRRTDASPFPSTRGEPQSLLQPPPGGSSPWAGRARRVSVPVGVPWAQAALPPQPGAAAGGRALLLLGRAAAQRRRYRNWLRLRETPASGGREAGAGRRCGVSSEPLIQEYPGLFPPPPPAASPRHRPARPEVGRAPRRPHLGCIFGSEHPRPSPAVSSGTLVPKTHAQGTLTLREAIPGQQEPREHP